VLREPHRGAYDRETIDKILMKDLFVNIDVSWMPAVSWIPTMYRAS